MLRFMLGAVMSAVTVYVLMQYPDLARRGIAAAREQIAVVARNSSSSAGSDTARSSSNAFEPESHSNSVNPNRARALTSELKNLSVEELWSIMDDSDFDRRTAAGAVLLRRANIPASPQGVEEVKRRYFKTGRTEDLQSGFSYLGLLAGQRVSEGPIVLQAQRFVERYPQHEACDNAVWALGELGSEDLIPYFFQIIDDPRKYGSPARERAFCCLVQCGRYSAARRMDMVPDFIRVFEEAHDPQTRAWTIQALAHCAPGVQASSINDWKGWWSRQARRNHFTERR